MAETSKSIQERDERYAEHSRSSEMRPNNMNEDGSVSDPGAQAAAERALRNATVPPNEREADDHSVGTPAWMEQNSPPHMHSDGGSTLVPEGSSVREQAGMSAEDVKRQDEEIERAAKDAEKKREEAAQKAEQQDKEDEPKGGKTEKARRESK